MDPLGTQRNTTSEDQENVMRSDHSKRSPDKAELTPLADHTNLVGKRSRPADTTTDQDLSFCDDLNFSIGELDRLETVGMMDICLKEQEDSLDLTSLCRCRVTEVIDGPTKLLHLEDWEDKQKKTSCLLLNEWAQCEVSQGDMVSIRAVPGSSKSRWEVRGDQERCRLVVQPDKLLSCTTLTTGLRCRRRAVLSELLRGMPGNDDKGVMTLGSVLHEVTQHCLLNEKKGEDRVRSILREILNQKRMKMQLCGYGLRREDIEQQAEEYVRSIARFLETHASGAATPSSAGKGSWDGCITCVLDVEDTLWVPQLGLKGKVDVLGHINNGPFQPPMTMPLELKTGRSSDDVAHRAQVVLYAAMLAELEHQSISPPPPGVVIYLREHTALEARVRPGEMRDGLIMRNEIIQYATRTPKVCQQGDGILQVSDLHPPSLPPIIKRPRECNFCPYTEVCTAFLSQEGINLETMDERMPQRALLSDKERFPQSHFDFFLRWTSLVQLEQSSCTVSMSRLWTSKPQQREAKNERCLTKLEVLDLTLEKSSGGQLVRFRRSSSAVSYRPLLAAAFNPGDLVVLGHVRRLIVSFAYVREVRTDTLQLLCDRDITRQFGKCGYHVDAYESFRGSTAALGSIAQLLSNTNEALRFRQLVIDRRSPEFDKTSQGWDAASKVLDDQFSLNEDQRSAIQRVFNSKDYVLIQGLPGTGKTATLVALVVALAAQGLSVLITSHTNSAVDNLLRRVYARGITMVRLGIRCHPELLQHSEETLLEQAKSPEHLRSLYDATLVVGATCTTAAQHWLLRQRTFDVCLVDEATQVPLPVTVAPLLAARRFVLVGDPRQLQPVVVNPLARELGMGETMFERLQVHSEAVATLGMQYRMNQVLCELANRLTYDGLLRCANQDVATATLRLTTELSEIARVKFPWLSRALSSKMEHSALFLDVGPSSSSNEEGTSRREASIVKALVHFLLQCGVPGEEVGVMSPFRAQSDLLSSMLGQRRGLEISTVDQFQGRDKGVAIISCVKSFLNTEELPKERHGILKDLKRLTVAITRARVKLLVVGDAESLRGAYEPCRRLLDALGSRNIITLRLSSS